MKKLSITIVLIAITLQLTSQNETVNGSLAVKNQIRWGNTGAALNTNQGASIELRGSGVPFLDFSNDRNTDFDMRLILKNNNLLEIAGGDVQMTNRLITKQSIKWGNTGAQLNTDQGASIELRGSGLPFLDFSNDPKTDFDMRLMLRNNNTLGVSGGDLAVDGMVKAKEIMVKTNVWADFVFDKAYDLPELSEVEKHIKEKGHLKDIPSANEVSKNGIHLGEMDSKLLQKIEELTLYIIEQDKRIKLLERKLN